MLRVFSLVTHTPNKPIDESILVIFWSSRENFEGLRNRGRDPHAIGYLGEDRGSTMSEKLITNT